MKINSKNIVISIGISMLIIMFSLAIFHTKKEEESINKNRYETICRVYKFYSNRSVSRYYYFYHFKDSTYKDNANLGYFDREKCIGKYYRMNLSTENPRFSEIFLDQEVTDSAEIVDAGFEYK